MVGQANSPNLLKPSLASALTSVGAPPPPGKCSCFQKHVQAWPLVRRPLPVDEGWGQLSTWCPEEEAVVPLPTALRGLEADTELHPCSPAGTPSGRGAEGPGCSEPCVPPSRGAGGPQQAEQSGQTGRWCTAIQILAVEPCRSRGESLGSGSVPSPTSS